MKTESRRVAAVLLLAAFGAGFAYAGTASMRLYAELFFRPAAMGASASIDEQIAPLKISAAEIREAVQRAAWPADADVALAVDPRVGGGEVSATQLQYAFSYLLYPKRIWLQPAAPDTRHGIVIGSRGQMNLVDLK